MIGGRGRVFRLDAVDLLGVEDGVALEERDLPLAVLATLAALVVVHLDLVGINHRGALLALADATAERECLLEGEPVRGGIALRHGCNPQRQHVDAAIGNTG
jgi:hypothetical protein